MPNYIVEFKVGAEMFCRSALPNPPRIGEKVRCKDSNGEEAIFQIEDIIYELTPGEHSYMPVTAQCKLF